MSPVRHLVTATPLRVERFHGCLPSRSSSTFFRVARRPSMSDDRPFDEWCRRLKASDRAAYAELFEAMYGPLFRYVCSITTAPDAARDVTQDVFVRLWDVRE